MIFNTLNHLPLRIMTTWNKKDFGDSILLHGTLQKILGNGMKNLKRTKKESLAIPETSSETLLEDSETVKIKNTLPITLSLTPTKNQMKNLTWHKKGTFTSPLKKNLILSVKESNI